MLIRNTRNVAGLALLALRPIVCMSLGPVYVGGRVRTVS
jgi:hypothetical protein